MTDNPVDPHSGRLAHTNGPSGHSDGAPVEEIDGRALAIGSLADPTVHLSLVVPTYNESANIGRLLRSLHEVLTGMGATFEIIVVDDGSGDETRALVRALAAPRVRLIATSSGGAADPASADAHDAIGISRDLRS